MVNGDAIVASAQISRPPKTGSQTPRNRSCVDYPSSRAGWSSRGGVPEGSGGTHARQLHGRLASMHAPRDAPLPASLQLRSKRALQDGPGQRSALTRSSNMTRRRHSFKKKSAGATIAGSKGKIAKKSPACRSCWLSISAYPVGGSRSYKDANTERSRASAA